MKLKISLTVISIVLILSACSQSVPKCSDTETTDLVKEIAAEEMANQLGAEAAKMFTYSVQTIRTTSTNKQTGAHECAAELQINANNGESKKLPITYTVELTDDGKQFFVNISGL